MSGAQLAAFLYETFKVPARSLILGAFLLALTGCHSFGWQAKTPAALEKAATNMLGVASTAASTTRSLTARGQQVSHRSRLWAGRLLQAMEGDGLLGLEEFATLYLLVPGTEPGQDAVEDAFEHAAQNGHPSSVTYLFS